MFPCFVEDCSPSTLASRDVDMFLEGDSGLVEFCQAWDTSLDDLDGFLIDQPFPYIRCGWESKNRFASTDRN
jgi:hypothetical protein